MGTGSVTVPANVDPMIGAHPQYRSLTNPIGDGSSSSFDRSFRPSTLLVLLFMRDEALEGFRNLNLTAPPDRHVILLVAHA